MDNIERGKNLPSPDTRDRLAKALGVDSHDLCGVSTNLGAAQPQLRAREGGRLLRERRCAAGLSQYQLAEKAGCRQGHVSGLEGRKGWNVRPPLAKAIAAALDCKFDDLFEPAPDAVVDGRTQPHAAPLEHRVVREAEAYAQAHGFWTVKQAADFLEYSGRSTSAHIERENLPVAEKRCFGEFVNTIHFLDPRDVKRFARGRRNSHDGRVKRFYDPAVVFRHEIDRGQDRGHAKIAAERAARRAEVHSRVRIDTGRRPMPDRERWAEMLAELEAELEARGERVTRQEALVLVALDDWEQFPAAWARDRWPRDASDSQSLSRHEYRDAAKRIRKALGRLTV